MAAAQTPGESDDNRPERARVDHAGDHAGGDGEGDVNTPAGDVLLTRAVRAEPLHAWEVVVSDAGAAAWLGEGASLGDKGDPWRAGDGAHGVVRSFHPPERVRVTWHTPEWDDGHSTVELSVVGDATSCVLSLHQDRLDGRSVAEAMQHWKEALGRLATVIEAPR